MDDVCEYDLLTGSHRACSALVGIGQGILSWKFFGPSTEVGKSRVIGWNLRALAKIWIVTGEPALLQRAKDLAASVEQFRGKLPSPQTSLVCHDLSRAQYALELHILTQEHASPWHMAVGLCGLACHGYTTGDAAIREVARSIVKYCVRDGIVVDALACDDHDDFNPKGDNQGVNTWIPSALAIAWRMSGDPAVKALAALMFDQYDTNLVTADDDYHWYHSAGKVLGK